MKGITNKFDPSHWDNLRLQKKLQEVRRQLDLIKIEHPDQYADARDTVTFQLWCQWLYAGPMRPVMRGAWTTLTHTPGTFVTVVWKAFLIYSNITFRVIPIAIRYPKAFPAQFMRAMKSEREAMIARAGGVIKGQG